MGDTNSNILFGIENIEFYDDFNYYTLNFVHYFLSGYLPYTHHFYVSSTQNAFMTYTPYLIYPPLYLYIISMFGNNPFWIVAIPLLILDILTGVFIYKIVIKVWKNHIIGSISCLIYLLNPLNLIYTEYYWLNTTIFTFFLLGSIYYLIKDRFFISTILLSLSIMCKQFAGIFLPILLIRISRRMQDRGLSKISQFKKYILILLTLSIPIGLLSIPYILPLYPDFPDYLYHILAIGNVDFNIILPVYQVPVDFVVPFIAMNFNNVFLSGLKFVVEFYILLIISTVLICCVYSFLIKRTNTYNKNTLIIILLILISMTLFFPRGFYKYYTVLFSPLMSLFIMKNLKNNGWEHWKHNATEIITDLISVGIYFLFSFSIIFIHRYFSPLLLLLMLIYYTLYGYIDFNSFLKKFMRIYSRSFLSNMIEIKSLNDVLKLYLKFYNYFRPAKNKLIKKSKRIKGNNF
ncbi:MAG: hypothetical protein ACTSPY_13435 [Candidatus Helarchaeota archaeon]